MAIAVAILTVFGIFSPRFHQGFENGYAGLLTGYRAIIKLFGKMKWLSLGVVAGAIALLVILMAKTPSGLVPNEDTGMLFVMVDMPPGQSQERTMEVLDQVDNIIQTTPGVKYSQKIAGYSFLAGQGATYGTFIVKLKDWEERTEEQSVDNIVKRIYGITSQMINDGRVVAFAPPMITGYSMTNGFEAQDAG